MVWVVYSMWNIYLISSVLGSVLNALSSRMQDDGDILVLKLYDFIVVHLILTTCQVGQNSSVGFFSNILWKNPTSFLTNLIEGNSTQNQFLFLEL